MRCAVVGHVEWVEFARVPDVPAAGEIVHAERVWEEPAGGGAVVARQLALLAGRCELFTALGDDELGRGRRALARRAGVDVHVQRRRSTTRRAWTHVDETASGRSPCSATSCCPAARCRSTATTPCSSSRATPRRCGRRAVRASSPRRPASGRCCRGGRHARSAGRERERRGRAVQRRARSAAPSCSPRARGADARTVSATTPRRPGPIVDTYGAGDSFCAALCFALTRGDALPDALGSRRAQVPPWSRAGARATAQLTLAG